MTPLSLSTESVQALQLKGTAFEHYCRTVSPRQWEDVTVLMLTACFDAAGKLEDSNTPVVLVAGFASIGRVWADFEREWSLVLHAWNVPHFHAGDFAHSVGPFGRFKGNEDNRRRLVSSLLAVIHSCGLRKFGAAIKKKDFSKAKSAMKLDDDITVDPYVLCARRTVDDLYAFACGEGIDTNIRTVFEKGDPEDLLRKHFDQHGFPDPDFAWSKSVIKKGKRQPSFLGLQAAGWIAWEYYVDFCRVFGVSKDPPTDKGRFAFSEFEGMPGNIIIPMVSNPSEDILNQLWGNT